MNKTCVITGHTSGIGKVFYEHFKQLGYEVIGFNRESGLDNVIETAKNCDVFINNCYADGIQLNFFYELIYHVKKMIISGSIVSDYPDENMIKYSNDKQRLEKHVITMANKRMQGKADILYLKLTGASVNEPSIVLNTIDFWLENPRLYIASFTTEDTY